MSDNVSKSSYDYKKVCKHIKDYGDFVESDSSNRSDKISRSSKRQKVKRNSDYATRSKYTDASDDVSHVSDDQSCDDDDSVSSKSYKIDPNDCCCNDNYCRCSNDNVLSDVTNNIINSKTQRITNDIEFMKNKNKNDNDNEENDIVSNALVSSTTSNEDENERNNDCNNINPFTPIPYYNIQFNTNTVSPNNDIQIYDNGDSLTMSESMPFVQMPSSETEPEMEIYYDDDCDEGNVNIEDTETNNECNGNVVFSQLQIRNWSLCSVVGCTNNNGNNGSCIECHNISNDMKLDFHNIMNNL